jgi:hypothetical protein
MTLHLTRSSRLWTLLLLGLEVFLLRSQKNATNRFYGETQRRDFRPFEDNLYLLIISINAFVTFYTITQAV